MSVDVEDLRSYAADVLRRLDERRMSAEDLEELRATAQVLAEAGVAAASELESMRAENAELRDCVDWKRKSLEQEIVGMLRAYGHWCPDSGADVITAVGLALSAHRWRLVSEPPEESCEVELLKIDDGTGMPDIRGVFFWTDWLADHLDEGVTHYRRFVAPGEA